MEAINMNATSIATDGSQSSDGQLQSDVRGTEGHTVAVTSNSPSLSPLNAPMLPAHIANLEQERGDGDEADDDDSEERRMQDEVNLALAYGAGEPVKRYVSYEAPREGANVTARSSEGATLEAKTAVDDDGLGKPSRSVSLALKTKVLHFTPSWFSVTMGTGVVASLLTLLGQIWGEERYSPFFQSFIRWPALAYLLVDIAIFLFFSAAFLARYVMFPQVLPLTFKHPQKSMFLGTIPMGAITITSNICQLGTTSFRLGMWPTFTAVGLWFFCCILSTVVALAIPWSIVTYQKGHRFEGTTAALLLPVVPPITAAATASVIAEHLTADYPTLAFTVMTVGYMQLGIGLPLALMILVLYLQRLILFKAPPREVIVSVFLPLGPCGQGGEAALHLGRVALNLFPKISSTPITGVPQLTLGVGEAMYGAGLLTALLLFALGVWWAVMGTATFLLEWRHGRIQFNMGFWSFTFPLASLAICTARLAIELDSLTLKIVYTAFVLANVLLWVSVAIPTVKGFFGGNLLLAPCIADLPLDPLQKQRESSKRAS